MLKSIQVYPPESKVKQGSHNGPYHIPQETVGLYGENHGIFGDIPMGLMYLTIIGFGICIYFAEAGKIGKR